MPFPEPKAGRIRFCSSPRYIELLEEIGTDVVELTGDHFADWGAEATLFTLQMYRERGWPYYGGGENIQDGRKPATFEHHAIALLSLAVMPREEGMRQPTKTALGRWPVTVIGCTPRLPA